jgi:hypothetical protein
LEVVDSCLNFFAGDVDKYGVPYDPRIRELIRFVKEKPEAYRTTTVIDQADGELIVSHNGLVPPISVDVQVSPDDFKQLRVTGWHPSDPSSKTIRVVDTGIEQAIGILKDLLVIPDGVSTSPARLFDPYLKHSILHKFTTGHLPSLARKLQIKREQQPQKAIGLA